MTSFLAKWSKRLTNTFDELIRKTHDRLANTNWVFMWFMRFHILVRTGSPNLAWKFGREDYEILEFDDFLTPGECDSLIQTAKEKGLFTSTINNDKGQQIVDFDIRKSNQTWLKDDDSCVVKKVSERLQQYVPLPLEHQEDMQVVKYDATDFYRRHYDTPYQSEAIKHFNRFCGPRVATFLIYLNDDFQGGETDFILAGKTVVPKKGKAILFYNLDINLTLIPESIHVGKEILQGEKWIANKWIRVWPFQVNPTFYLSAKSWMMKVEKPKVT